jgi:uncharacterized protein YfaT (DUF1175 family)
MNELNLRFLGLTFTFNQDQIEISASCYATESNMIESSVRFMLRDLEQALKVTVPAIFEFVSQKLIYSLDSEGVIVGIRCRHTIYDFLEMVESGWPIGHA